MIRFLVGLVPSLGSWVFSIGLILTLIGIGFGVFAGWDRDIRFLAWVGYITFGSLVGLMIQAY